MGKPRDKEGLQNFREFQMSLSNELSELCNALINANIQANPHICKEELMVDIPMAMIGALVTNAIALAAAMDPSNKGKDYGYVGIEVLKLLSGRFEGLSKDYIVMTRPTN